MSTPDGEVNREVSTGTFDRQANMVLFAEEALKLFLEVLNTNASGKKTNL